MAKKLNPPRLKNKRRAKRVVYLGGSFKKAQKTLGGPVEKDFKKQIAEIERRHQIIGAILAVILGSAIIGYAAIDAYRSTHPKPKEAANVTRR